MKNQSLQACSRDVGAGLVPARPRKPAALRLDEPIGPDAREQMEKYLLSGAKPREKWMTGVELELIGFRTEDLTRIGSRELTTILGAYSDEQLVEDGLMIGASGPAGWVTVEPGGQLEFSGSPHPGIEATESALAGYLSWLGERARELEITFLGIGFDPIRTLAEQNWVEKKRYSVMRPYLQSKGARGLDMMTRTASIQVNVDYDSAEDLARKYVLGNRLAPIVGAIFANSPFREGKLTGFKSERALVWLDTDRHRCGIAAPAIDKRFSLDAFIDHILSAPMFLVRRGDELREMTHVTFAEFLRRGGDGSYSDQPVLGDFVDHLTTIFTEARIKQWIELRSVDGGGWTETLAAQALWKGLLYDRDALDEGSRLMPVLDRAEFVELQWHIARDGLQAVACGIRVLDLARALVEVARSGLNAIAPDEVRYLDPVADRVLKEGIAPADILIRNYEGKWQGDIRKAIEYLRVV